MERTFFSVIHQRESTRRQNSHPDKINSTGQNKQVEKELLKYIQSLIREKFFSKSIKVAEAAKVIENSQRDINIVFINEVSKICNKINISTYDVLEASNQMEFS